MKKQVALKTVFVISILGILFSGWLSYGELFKGVCSLGSTCPSVAEIPACVYGFVMYAVLFVVSLMGIKSKK